MLLRILSNWVGVFLMVVGCADAAGRDNVWQPAQDNVTWRSECGACHMAFPPGLLPVDDWLDIMSRLEKHYGVDASLEPKARAEIYDYLKQNGASSRMFGSRDEEPRITTSDRFISKHRSAIRLWVKGQIKPLSDCASCHKEAGESGAKLEK
jgi:hypothetical protein